MNDRLRLPGHRDRTPAWYRTVISIDVFTLVLLGVAWALRRPSWPVVLIMLPIAAHLAATVYLAIRDARRQDAAREAGPR